MNADMPHAPPPMMAIFVKLISRFPFTIARFPAGLKNENLNNHAKCDDNHNGTDSIAEARSANSVKSWPRYSEKWTRLSKPMRILLGSTR